ncbi:MAG: branched-chain amino acid transport system II carrier protein [Oscillospiraceae bacterium]|nr:branched-chain amino acid transport system II carrier protein [Oscillospiraceae bacterium]
MKLTKGQMLTVSFMLFSLFFGAGNLIFPPFLGQNAAQNTVPALIGFLITAVVLPVLGVIVVAQSDGLDKLGARVNGKFAIIFTMLIYLSIGPGLGIPRAASVPFEMAVAPYLPEGASFGLFMLIYSLVFFLIAAWLALNPSKLVNRIGHYLTPSLLTFIVFLFISFVVKGTMGVAPAQPEYQSAAFLKGFCEGYQTMDTIAALNFGLVISITLQSLGIKEKKGIIGHTVVAGIAAGTILTAVYVMLTFMGMQSSGIYPIQENGAWTLRQIVYQLFGEFGAIILAAIFTLACLTTCVGLINSISQYFSTLFKGISYNKFVLGITIFSFAICNQGLNTILSVSVPVLNAIYPVSIMLIVLGLCDNFIKGNRFIYPLTILGTAVISVIYAVDGIGISLGFISTICRSLPLYDLGFGWVIITAAMLVISFILNAVMGKKQNA